MPKLLVVDDDRLLTSALTVRLRAEGMDVIACNNAHDAAVIALVERPDLILLDISMPRFSGLELHECLQMSARGRSIPIVYLSGSASESEQRVALRQGAKAFLGKPFDTPTLVDAIRRALAP